MTRQSFRTRVVRIGAALVVCAIFVACRGKSDDVSATPNVAAAPESVTYRPLCTEDGKWNECVLMDRLKHSGVAPAIDSTDTTRVAFFTPPARHYNIGRSAKLIVFYYADSVQAKKVWGSLDTLRMVPKDAPLTADSLLPWGQRPASIRAGNLLGVFVSQKPEQIERVLRAFAAGLPAPRTN